jgi:competence transcription factor ComK
MVAIHYDKKITCGWITNGDCIKYSNSDLHDTGKNEHTRVTFTNHYDHVIGHSYNRRP